MGDGRTGKREPSKVGAVLFGLEQAKPRNHDRKEAAALVEVPKALRTHPAVAWCERMSSGVARIGAGLCGSAGLAALTCWGNSRTAA